MPLDAPNKRPLVKGLTFIIAFCETYNIDPTFVTDISIHADVNGVVRTTIDMVTDDRVLTIAQKLAGDDE